MKRDIWILIIGLAGAVVDAAGAQPGRSYQYAHLGYVEGEAFLQSATQAGPSEASVNLPVLSGDRAWTSPHARAEVIFADGSLLRMDGGTKVDFVEFGDGRRGETLVRVWSGSIIIRLGEDPTGFRIDTPSGSVFPVSRGLYRIDVDGVDVVTLSLYEGVAELASESGSMLVRRGQRSLVQAGRRPERPYEFNTAQWDDFDVWSDERDERRRNVRRVAGVPEQIVTYTKGLHRYGHWRLEPSLGYVWYPTVSVGWSPYYHGRWHFRARFGWTWVSYEPWGWAPYHYGRWGYSHRGWYWIPGAYWAPAWVSWAVGPSWVGWCPLGYYDRPIHAYRSVFARGGRAVPRHHGWRFAARKNFGSTAVERTRLRATDVLPTSRRARVLDSGGILGRNLEPRVVGAAAMTRVPVSGLASLQTQTPARTNVSTTGGARSPKGQATTRGRILRGPSRGVSISRSMRSLDRPAQGGASLVRERGPVENPDTEAVGEDPSRTRSRPGRAIIRRRIPATPSDSLRTTGPGRDSPLRMGIRRSNVGSPPVGSDRDRSHRRAPSTRSPSIRRFGSGSTSGAAPSPAGATVKGRPRTSPAGADGGTLRRSSEGSSPPGSSMRSRKEIGRRDYFRDRLSTLATRSTLSTTESSRRTTTRPPASPSGKSRSSSSLSKASNSRAGKASSSRGGSKRSSGTTRSRAKKRN